VGITTECLNNIKIIKLYSWIDVFSSMIESKRREELGVLLRRMLTLSLTLGSITVFPLLLQFSSFASFIGFGGSIDLSTAYSIIAIF
jgi:hypothetical protein